MSTPSSTPSHSADGRSTAAPYAFPQTGSASLDREGHAALARVGPYVPERWRRKPALDQLVTPHFVAPIVRVELPVAEWPVAELPVAEMPPSYPTPAYFTPLGLQAQDDFLTPEFGLQAIVESSGELSAVPFVEPLASSEPAPQTLPWIDDFLSSTPARAMDAVDERVDSYTPPASDALVDEAVRTEWPMTEADEEAPTPSDAWALDEAAEEMRSLADELRDHEGLASNAAESVPLFDASQTPEPLPAWRDDDIIDIMPVQKAHSAVSSRVPTPGASSAVEPWADRARRAGNDNAEAAARALELLARRVRDGEISLAGYEPRLGDAAALAAALAALLGVHR